MILGRELMTMISRIKSVWLLYSPDLLEGYKEQSQSYYMQYFYNTVNSLYIKSKNILTVVKEISLPVFLIL